MKHVSILDMCKKSGDKYSKPDLYLNNKILNSTGIDSFSKKHPITFIYSHESNYVIFISLTKRALKDSNFYSIFILKDNQL